jgi:hypothetical protein
MREICQSGSMSGEWKRMGLYVGSTPESWVSEPGYGTTPRHSSTLPYQHTALSLSHPPQKT